MERRGLLQCQFLSAILLSGCAALHGGNGDPTAPTACVPTFINRPADSPGGSCRGTYSDAATRRVWESDFPVSVDLQLCDILTEQDFCREELRIAIRVWNDAMERIGRRDEPDRPPRRAFVAGRRAPVVHATFSRCFAFSPDFPPLNADEDGRIVMEHDRRGSFREPVCLVGAQAVFDNEKRRFYRLIDEGKTPPGQVQESYRLAETMAHELGHVLGLHHPMGSRAGANLMATKTCGEADYRLCEGFALEEEDYDHLSGRRDPVLGPADLEGLDRIYSKAGRSR